MRLPVFQSPHGQFAAIVVAYCVLYFVLRLILSPVLGTDDVEQAVCAQSLALGCDLRQPPLYTWLQWLTNQLAGEGLLAIFLLKYGLLALLYWLLYRIGLRLFADTATAGIAALSLWLAYPFAVGVHQGVTHSLLLSVLLAASFLTALRLEARRSLGGYLLLGLLLGLGMLAKYSFALYAAGLVLAALSLPRYQVLLLDARALATLLAALLVVTPHGLWAWERLDAMHGALGGLGQLNAPAAYWPRVAGGLASLASALLQFLFPLWLIVLIFYPRAFRPLPAPLPDGLRLAGRAMAISAGLLVLAIVFGGPVEIKPRWMHVILLLAPLYLFGRIAAAGYFPVAKHGYVAALFLLPLLVIGVWLGQIFLAPKYGKPTRFHAPYDQLARKIQSVGFASGTLVANELHLAGNMRIAFPDSRIVTPVYAHYLPPAIDSRQCLAVWQSQGHSPIPAELLATLKLPETERPAPRYIEARYRRSERERMELGFLLLPGGSCP